MKLDIHVHLAGVGTQGSGCWLSPRFARRPLIRLLRRLSGVTAEQMRSSIDQDWAEGIARRVRESELDRAVVLGFDGVYDARGELDRERSQLIVPPSWVFEVCRRHPDALLPGPSINPFRRDAMERLEECIGGGAVLLKWLPAAQAIDPTSPRLRPFYSRLAEVGLPLLVHAGGSENTFREVAPALSDVRLLRMPLEAGVPVICAHSGARVLLSRDPDQLPLVREMLLEFPRFWVDNSGMANPGRFPYLARLAHDPLFRERTLHGSDYPVPAHAFYFPRRLGPRRVRELDAIANPFDRSIAIHRALGYPEGTLTRAAGVLGGNGRWRVENGG
ncbi:MAG TPA: amidohydrolase family protein [Longimicrobiaceae bacterium]|nr:amidohydrolase family protein [Longimicrobiaceae bacterium]